MKIEVLYPEVCCLYGDRSNIDYLAMAVPGSEIIMTSLTDDPRFAYEPVDLVYLGSLSEHSQELVLERLRPFANVIRLLLDRDDTVFLATGNAMELFGQYIQREDGTRCEALGITDTYAVRQTPNRFNSVLLAEFDGMKVIGYITRFSHSFGLKEEDALMRITKGTGINPDTKLEGVRRGKLIATYLVGPLLPTNPDFTLWLLELCGIKDAALPFEEAARKAYEKRLADTEAATVLLQ